MKTPYLIAEMACSHDGDPANAKKIIEAAVRAGADAIQFQIWRAEEVAAKRHPSFAKLRELELSREQWTYLHRYARSLDERIDIIACVYEKPSLEFALSLGVNRIKIHSSEIANLPLLSMASQARVPIHLCLGGASMREIETAIAVVSPSLLLHGIQTFPTPIEEAHLARIASLKKRFSLPVGYQDHCAGDSPEAFWIPAAAIGHGCDALEKHLTDSRARRGADHESALEPDEFARFVRMTRAVAKATGNGDLTALTAKARDYQSAAARIAVASRDLPVGHVVLDGDVCYLRVPERGLCRRDAAVLVGKKLRRELPAETPFAPDDFE